MQRAVQDGSDGFFVRDGERNRQDTHCPAVVKLFLRSGNTSRVLSLVDRLELQDQAHKVFTALLSADFQTVVNEETRKDWNRAEIRRHAKTLTLRRPGATAP